MTDEFTASSSVKVGNNMGIHARPAAQLVHIAGRYKSNLKLCRVDGRGEADCRSVLSLLMLAACKDTELILKATGADAAEAVAAIADLFNRNFDEN